MIRVCNVPWLFNIFFDRVVRQMIEREMGKGVKLRYENEGSWQCEKMKEVDKFNYLRVKISTGRGMREKVAHREERFEGR